MQTHVYANSQEIACKAAGKDGVSPQAFPDPCWSPPGPGAGPVVIPYPNTCFADSISNGTSTVFICGKEVAIEDQSFFATSTGNEPATSAFGKGVATGVITGKAYFTQWSFDVVFEGFGVPRHTDMVSHNHGSVPGNTPLFPYLSRGILGGFPCKDEEARIKRECAREEDGSEARKDVKKHSKLSKLLKDRNSGTKRKGQRDAKKWHWTDDHCDGLEVPIPDAEAAKKYANEMKEAFESLPGEFQVLNAVKAELQDMVMNAAGKAAAKLAVKTGLKQAAGSAVPLAGNIVMGLWSLYDAAATISDVREIKAVATAALEKLEILKSKLTELQRMASEFKDFDKLPLKEQEEKALKLAADGQDLLATLNDCTRARKCNLVPYTAQRGAPPDTPAKLESTKGGGCCNGQTGHHLLPEKSLEGACPGYKHALAPTVCVEGTSQNLGSHKRVHGPLAEEHSVLKRNGKVAADGSMSMYDALEAAAQSHENAFPLSRCDKKCIRAQLDAYYKKACGAGRPKSVNAQSKYPKPDIDNGPTD